MYLKMLSAVLVTGALRVNNAIIDPLDSGQCVLFRDFNTGHQIRYFILYQTDRYWCSQKNCLLYNFVCTTPKKKSNLKIFSFFLYAIFV